MYKSNPWDSYDSWKTTPPDDDDPLCDKINEVIDDYDFLSKQDWFSDCVDWDKVNEKLYQQFKQENEDREAEMLISLLEERNSL